MGRNARSRGRIDRIRRYRANPNPGGPSDASCSAASAAAGSAVRICSIVRAASALPAAAFASCCRAISPSSASLALPPEPWRATIQSLAFPFSLETANSLGSALCLDLDGDPRTVNNYAISDMPPNSLIDYCAGSAFAIAVGTIAIPAPAGGVIPPVAVALLAVGRSVSALREAACCSRPWKVRRERLNSTAMLMVPSSNKIGDDHRDDRRRQRNREHPASDASVSPCRASVADFTGGGLSLIMVSQDHCLKSVIGSDLAPSQDADRTQFAARL